MSDRPLPRWGSRARTLSRVLVTPLGTLICVMYVVDVGLGWLLDFDLARSLRTQDEHPAFLAVASVFTGAMGVLVVAWVVWGAAWLNALVRPVRAAHDER